jgi:hypothetical protein
LPNQHLTRCLSLAIVLPSPIRDIDADSSEPWK